MGTEIRVLIADDHPVFRQGLRQVIEKDRSMKVVAEAEDGEAALDQMRAHQPEVAILDLDMPKLDGFAVVRAAQAERLATAVVFLTMHKDEDLFNEALDLGAKGYVLKDSAITDIIGSIKAASRGQNFISPQL